MSAKLPFHANSETVTVLAGTGGTTIYAVSIDGAAAQVQVTNPSTEPTFLSFGTSTVTATYPTTGADVAGYMIPPTSQVVLTPGKATYAAASHPSTSNSLFLTPGTGGS